MKILQTCTKHQILRYFYKIAKIESNLVKEFITIKRTSLSLEVSRYSTHTYKQTNKHTYIYIYISIQYARTFIGRKHHDRPIAFDVFQSLFNVANIGDVTDFQNVYVFLYRQIIVFNKYRASIISWLTVHLPPSTLNDKVVKMEYACRRGNAVRFVSPYIFPFFKHLHTLVEGTGQAKTL